MKTLYTAFNGKTNTSKLLLDKINSKHKLYLKNSFKTSVEELIKELKTNNYDLIISFGQAPLEKNCIKIETKASDNNFFKTDYDYTSLKQSLEREFKVIISDNAGKYLCNNLYYHGLKYIEENNLKTKMIFIHIPKINKIGNIDELSNFFK